GADKTGAERDPAPLQRPERDLVADHREAGQHRVLDLSLQVRVVAEEVPEHGHEDEHQGKQREEAVVGDQRCLLAGLVVAELLHTRKREPDPGVLALVAVDAIDHPLQRVRHGPYVPRSRVRRTPSAPTAPARPTTAKPIGTARSDTARRLPPVLWICT